MQSPIEVGAVLEGKVKGITNFGAFVTLPGGKSGLIHISEVANTYVNDVHDYLSEGQSVKVRVLSVGSDGKISLSAKRAEEAQPAPKAPPRKSASAPAPSPVQTAAAQNVYVPTRSGDQNFEDKLKQFMQESDKKMSGNRLYEQQRKSRGRRK